MEKCMNRLSETQPVSRMTVIKIPCTLVYLPYCPIYLLLTSTLCPCTCTDRSEKGVLGRKSYPFVQLSLSEEETRLFFFLNFSLADHL